MGSLTPHAIADIAVPWHASMALMNYIFLVPWREARKPNARMLISSTICLTLPITTVRLLIFGINSAVPSADQWISFENPMWKIPRLMRIRSAFVVRSCTISSNIQSIEFCKGAELNEMRR
ncbi:hypothetical protein PG2010B_1127 [Bifidobacterium animalis subsp. lactis]|uniref:Uncharacterized protein n=1 Tax=Bifidobacterium animalis subsp. lactis TaxID=302911 RepID=A0A8B3RI39_BIFAN|nr:hypothetical protein PG2007B_1129 [Bifidobacterium animalis subsp. lactis]RYM92069.1 hypothetical protein PG2010B_1127 [Bifidobacterium animalis subsp. lactis]RYM94488.1 hypothetical protein PG2011B_1203 [Bifidobacterium animalis subsp. lactis]